SPADPNDGASPGVVTLGAAAADGVALAPGCAPADVPAVTSNDATGGASAGLAGASNGAIGGESKRRSYSSGSCGEASTTALSSRTRTPALRNSRSSRKYSPIVRCATPTLAGCSSAPPASGPAAPTGAGSATSLSPCAASSMGPAACAAGSATGDADAAGSRPSCAPGSSTVSHAPSDHAP